MRHWNLPGHPFFRAAGRAAMAGLFLCLLLSASAPARALDLQPDETRPGLRLSVAEDFVHAVGSVVVSARYGGASGVPVPSVYTPSARSCCSISPSRRMRLNSRFMRWIGARGVPVGATTANQPLNSNPGKVSEKVGTSGSSGRRLGELTASARSCP